MRGLFFFLLPVRLFLLSVPTPRLPREDQGGWAARHSLLVAPAQPHAALEGSLSLSLSIPLGVKQP